MDAFSVDVQEASEQDVKLALKGRITINNAEFMKPAFEPYVEETNQKNMTLDLAAVDDLDACGLQLLMCLKQHQERNGRQLTIIGLQSQFTQDLTTLGLVGTLV